jgi:hypothetical protein
VKLERQKQHQQQQQPNTLLPLKVEYYIYLFIDLFICPRWAFPIQNLGSLTSCRVSLSEAWVELGL